MTCQLLEFLVEWVILTSVNALLILNQAALAIIEMELEFSVKVYNYNYYYNKT